MDRVLDCNFLRKFGVELEFNTLNGIVHETTELGHPLGSLQIAEIIEQTLNTSVQVNCLWNSSNNNKWIIKPDLSCGMEVCTPILKGWNDLKSLLIVVEALKNASISCDQRCSLHVHIDISDLNNYQLASVLVHYIKCEHVIFDSVSKLRKTNGYCKCLGTTDLFKHDFKMDVDDIIDIMSNAKNYSMNIFNFFKGGFDIKKSQRKTIEFRLAESDMCKNAFFVKNWVRFLLHFVEITKDLLLPKNYCEGDPWSGLLWLDVKDVFKILKFDEPLSEGMKQVKKWFISRILDNGFNNVFHGIWSNEARCFARKEFLEIYEQQLEFDEETNVETLLFSEKYSI